MSSKAAWATVGSCLKNKKQKMWGIKVKWFPAFSQKSAPQEKRLSLSPREKRLFLLADTLSLQPLPSAYSSYWDRVPCSRLALNSLHSYIVATLNSWPSLASASMCWEITSMPYLSHPERRFLLVQDMETFFKWKFFKMQIIFHLDSICKAQGAGRHSSRDGLDCCIQLNNASMGKRVQLNQRQK